MFLNAHLNKDIVAAIKAMRVPLVVYTHSGSSIHTEAQGSVHTDVWVVYTKHGGDSVYKHGSLAFTHRVGVHTGRGSIHSEAPGSVHTDDGVVYTNMEWIAYTNMEGLCLHTGWG